MAKKVAKKKVAKKRTVKKKSIPTKSAKTSKAAFSSFDPSAVDNLLNGTGAEPDWVVLPYYGTDAQQAKPCRKCKSINNKIYAAPGRIRLNFKVCGDCGFRQFICGVVKPKMQKVCLRLPVKGRWRCPRHGGKAKRGMNSHLYKGSGYSKCLPTRFAEQVWEAEADPDLLSARREVALLRVRIGECLKRLEDGGSERQWNEITKANDALLKAREKGDLGALDKALTKLHQAVADGNQQRDAWDDVTRAVKDFCQIQQHEQRWEKDKFEMMTEEDAKRLFGMMAAAVAENVLDVDVRLKIFTRLSELATQAPGRPTLLMLPDDEHRLRHRLAQRERKKRMDMEEVGENVEEVEVVEEETVEACSGDVTEVEAVPVDTCEPDA